MSISGVGTDGKIDGTAHSWRKLSSIVFNTCLPCLSPACFPLSLPVPQTSFSLHLCLLPCLPLCLSTFFFLSLLSQPAFLSPSFFIHIGCLFFSVSDTQLVITWNKKTWLGILFGQVLYSLNFLQVSLLNIRFSHLNLCFPLGAFGLKCEV